jgi:hypothetical protein
MENMHSKDAEPEATSRPPIPTKELLARHHLLPPLDAAALRADIAELFRDHDYYEIDT